MQHSCLTNFPPPPCRLLYFRPDMQLVAIKLHDAELRLQFHCTLLHWRTLRIRNAGNDYAKRSLTAAANDTWQARFVWLQFIFHALQWPHKATRARHCPAALLGRWLLAAFVPEPAFHITTIFYAQLSGFLCICGTAAYVKNYTAKARVWLAGGTEREREQLKCLPCT